LFDVPDDELVIARARKGDMAAMETLYRAFEVPVYNLGRRLLTRPEEAEEVLQETFLEVFRSLKRFRGEGRVGLWIRKIAVSKALMRVRTRASRPEAQFPLEEPADPSVVASGRWGEAGAMLDRLKLETALARLPEVTRTVVWLHDVEGYTHEEIGSFMKKTPSFSKSQLARAHARLREFLSPPEEAVPCTPAATN
jgi:RNA polymerase sigma-70 factor (ECF subfamily)